MSPREVSWLEQSLRHLQSSIGLRESSGYGFALERDRLMSENLRWLMTERFPGRKVIVWAATAHFIRNSTLIKNPTDTSMYRMPYEAGNHVATWLGRDLYTIAFTTYDGFQGGSRPPGSRFASDSAALMPAPVGTLEYRLNTLGAQHVFVPLDSLAASRAFPERFETLVLGRIVNTAPWERVVDAVLFTRRSHPVRYVR